jgi:hypothetical protein
MGQCIKCGKETYNQYTYYSGDVEDYSVTKSGNILTTKTKYTNIETRSSFLCTNCFASQYLPWFKYVFISIALFALASFLFYLSIITKLGILAIICIILLFFSILLAIASILIYRQQRNDHDKRVSDDDGANWLITEAKKTAPQREYFIPSEYKKLKKN